jgi:hypothetical protein
MINLPVGSLAHTEFITGRDVNRRGWLIKPPGEKSKVRFRLITILGIIM